MVRISNAEAKLLRKMGVKDQENGISTTTGHHKSHYMAETYKNMEKLRKIRQED